MVPLQFPGFRQHGKVVRDGADEPAGAEYAFLRALLQCSSLHGFPNFRMYGLRTAKAGHVRAFVAKSMEKLHRIADDCLLFRKRRLRAHPAIRQAKQLRVTGQFKKSDMAHQGALAQVGFGHQDAFEQLPRGDAALHQEICAPCMEQLCRSHAGVLACIRYNNREALRIRSERGEYCADRICLPNEHRIQNGFRMQHGFEGMRIICSNDRYGFASTALHARGQIRKAPNNHELLLMT